jgi:RND family efflux transporter MFP subunit
MKQIFRRVSMTWLATALLGACAVAVAATPPALSSGGGDGSRARVHLVKSETAVTGHWVAASVQAVRRATIATRLAASVRAVHVDEGTAVAAGALLVSLADADLRGQLAAAEAALASASAHERRIRTLAAERAATPSELEAATAQRAQAQAAVAAVRANLQYTELRAPFAGTIQARRVEPGDMVGPGQPLVMLEGSSLELAASLSEQEARGLRLGQKLRFRAGEVEGWAEIASLTPGGDSLSHRRGLRARMTGTPAELRTGSFARIEVPGGAPAGAWLPRSAFVERGDLTGVFVATDGRAELRWVSVGEVVGDRIAVRAGLRESDRVIDAPTAALRDGQPIEIAP